MDGIKRGDGRLKSRLLNKEINNAFFERKLNDEWGSNNEKRENEPEKEVICTPGGGGGDSAYEGGGDACRKFWIKPLKETNLGVA